MPLLDLLITLVTVPEPFSWVIRALFALLVVFVLVNLLLGIVTLLRLTR